MDTHYPPFDPADHQKHQRIADIQNAQPFVVDGGHPSVERIDKRARSHSRAWQCDGISRHRAISSACSPSCLPKRSTECLQICGHGVQLLLVQLHRWHQGARFDSLGIPNPEPEIFWCVAGCAGCNRISTHQVGEVGTKASFRRCARHSVAVGAGSSFEYSLPLGSRVTHYGRLGLLLNPSVEVLMRLNINTQKHLGVLCPAVLSTLAQVKTGLVEINPHTVWVIS